MPSYFITIMFKKIYISIYPRNFFKISYMLINIKDLKSAGKSEILSGIPELGKGLD